jgi:hypothetical protein
MALFHKLYAEVVNDENKGDGAPLVSPKSWSRVRLEITKGMEPFSEEVVGEFASLFEPIDALVNFKVNPSIMSEVREAVFVDKFGRDVANFDSHIFWSVKRSAQVEIGDVKGGKACIGGGEHIVELEFD